jgi:hypothetical protein
LFQLFNVSSSINVEIIRINILSNKRNNTLLFGIYKLILNRNPSNPFSKLIREYSISNLFQSRFAILKKILISEDFSERIK